MADPCVTLDVAVQDCVEQREADLSRSQWEYILRVTGLDFIVDFFDGYEEGFIAREFESTHWQSGESLLAAIGDQGTLKLDTVRDLGERRGMHWRQAVFRKDTAG